MTQKNVTRAIKVAIVVGSMLNIINSYDVLCERSFTYRNILRIILTYITPFCVSLYSSIKASKTL
jgi:ABC-type multidrug transport system permease subunit